MSYDRDNPTPGDYDDRGLMPPADLGARRLINPRSLPARIHNLKAAGRSGAHALLSFQESHVDTIGQRLGAGAHALLFGKPWAVWKEQSKASADRGEAPSAANVAPRSAKNKAWTDFVAANAGAAILSASELEQAKRIEGAIRSCARAERILFPPDVIHERSIIWTQCGRARQSTPDARNVSVLAELKSTRCAHAWSFLRDAEKLGYHAQLADQLAAIEYETGKRPRDVCIVAVENAPPYNVEVYDVRPSALAKGARLCEMWLERLQIYEATDQWGSYTSATQPWELLDEVDPAQPDPAWATAEASAEGAA